MTQKPMEPKDNVQQSVGIVSIYVGFLLCYLCRTRGTKGQNEYERLPSGVVDGSQATAEGKLFFNILPMHFHLRKAFIHLHWLEEVGDFVDI